MSVSLLVSNVQVTGSALIYQANFSGIGGTQVVRSGNYVLVSGGAGGGGSVTQGQLDSLSGFTTGMSGYLQSQITMASAGVTSVNGRSGALNIIGSGGISVITNGQNIIISGGDWATSGNLQATGQTLYLMLTGESGALLATIVASGNAAVAHANGIGINLSGNLTQTGVALGSQIAQTGQQAWTAAQNNAVNLSGNLTTTGQTLYNLITAGSGLYVQTGTIMAYVTGIVTGWDTGWFSYRGYTFSTIPAVVATVELSGTTNLYGVAISGRSTSGFYGLFTDIITESGVSLNIIAKS